MSDTDTLARLRALVAEAEALDKATTPGPWGNYANHYVCRGDAVRGFSAYDDTPGRQRGKPDAHFIARARTLLPALVRVARVLLECEANAPVQAHQRGKGVCAVLIDFDALARALGDAPGGEGGGERG